MPGAPAAGACAKMPALVGERSEDGFAALTLESGARGGWRRSSCRRRG